MGSVPYFLHFFLLSPSVFHQSPHPFRQHPHQSSNAADVAAFRECAATEEASSCVGSPLRLPRHQWTPTSGTDSSIRPLRGMVVGKRDLPQIQRQRPGWRRANDQCWRRPGTSRAERRGVVPRWPLEVASRIDPPHAKRTDSLQSRRHRPAQGLPGAIQDGEATKGGRPG